MRKFLKKLKGKFSTKGATSSPVPGASSAEPAPRSSSVESIVTPAPAPAVVAEPEVAAAPSSNAGFSTVWNGVLDVLRIAQASLDSVPVPGLKSAIGGFLEIVRQLDTVGANVDAIRQLEDTVKFFNQSVSKPLETYEGKPSVPSELSEAIDALSGEFVTATSPLESYRDKSGVYRWANHQQIAAEVGKAGGRIHNAVAAFNVAQGVRHYLQIEQLREGIEEIKAHKRDEASAEEAKQLDSLLNTLPRTLNAGYDTNRPGAPSNCFPGTRKAIIEEVKQWLHRPISDTTKPVFWLNGLAGIGKSTIARTIAEYAKESDLLGSTFFFVRQHAELSNAKLFFGTIVRDFAKKLPKFGAAVAEALKEDDKLSHASLATQYSTLLFTPLKDLKLSSPLLLIIDALDECERDEVDGAKELLRHILRCSGIPGLRILITSRPERHITTSFDQAVNIDKIVIHEVDKLVASDDIKLYLQYELQSICERFRDTLPKGWPSPDMILALVGKAGRLFIWAATAIKFINDDDEGPVYQLDSILKGSQEADVGPHAELDKLYETVLSACVAKIRQDRLVELHCLLQTIVLLKDPLTLKGLGAFTEVSDPKLLLARIQSIVPLPPHPEDRVKVYHPSFPDFVLQRCKNPQLRVDVEKHEQWMALRCLNLLIAELGPGSSLKVDMKDLSVRPTSVVKEEVQYACCFWTSHLCKLQSVDEEVRDTLEKFTGQGGGVEGGVLLQWMKVLRVIGKVDHIVQGSKETLLFMGASCLAHIQPVVHDAYSRLSWLSDIQQWQRRWQRQQQQQQQLQLQQEERWQQQQWQEGWWQEGWWQEEWWQLQEWLQGLLQQQQQGLLQQLLQQVQHQPQLVERQPQLVGWLQLLMEHEELEIDQEELKRGVQEWCDELQQVWWQDMEQHSYTLPK